MLDEASLALVRLALAEDLAGAGDVTTDAIIDAQANGRAMLIAKEHAVLAGADVFDAVYEEVDASVRVAWSANDGDAIERGDVVARVDGPMRAILIGERTALNFVQRLSGVATMTRAFVDATPPTVQIRDTRKTTPGMRALQKRAVLAGGGVNHRMGLYDAILIKDNHVAAAGGIAPAVQRARAAKPGMRVQIECESLDQVREAIEAGADEVLLDNMDAGMLAKAAELCAGRVRTEASGGITLDTVAAVARSGVDAISVGALTHSAPSVDLSLEIERTEER